jgi:hypothetical protein
VCECGTGSGVLHKYVSMNDPIDGKEKRMVLESEILIGLRFKFLVEKSRDYS